MAGAPDAGRNGGRPREDSEGGPDDVGSLSDGRCDKRPSRSRSSRRCGACRRRGRRLGPGRDRRRIDFLGSGPGKGRRWRPGTVTERFCSSGTMWGTTGPGSRALIGRRATTDRCSTRRTVISVERTTSGTTHPWSASPRRPFASPGMRSAPCPRPPIATIQSERQASQPARAALEEADIRHPEGINRMSYDFRSPRARSARAGAGGCLNRVVTGSPHPARRPARDSSASPPGAGPPARA